ncbi:MAG: riboflavin synthase, partial [Candidatus Aminicenantes bacterium]|nr:riboflavin synthase [Candidatus Aminicenantes bacterium]
MFTGIIKHSGAFKSYRSGKRVMIIEAPSVADKLGIGESLAINGVCLSLTKKEKDTLYFDLSDETLRQTTLGSLQPKGRLNLELSLTLSTPLGGHLITGHVDGKGKVLKIIKRANGRRISVSFRPELRSYFIPKGSVALNGVSLTVAEIMPSAFEVELIPLTIQDSNLNSLKAGDEVNIECDIIGKYVYNW